jgi:hypothetical protein
MVKNTPFIEVTRNQHSRAMETREKRLAETLVHPVMLAHRNPKRVAAIGGTTEMLNEILKHTTVEQVYVFEDACKRSAPVGLMAMDAPSRYDADPRVHRIQVSRVQLPLTLRSSSTSGGAYDVIFWRRRYDPELELGACS